MIGVLPRQKNTLSGLYIVYTIVGGNELLGDLCGARLAICICVILITLLIHPGGKPIYRKSKQKLLGVKNDFLPVTKNVRGGKLGH